MPRPTPLRLSGTPPVSTMSLQERVRRAIERDGLIPPGSRVLAAVSGGSDSVALVLPARDLADACGFTLAGIAHLNHGLRGARKRRGRGVLPRPGRRASGCAIEVGRRDVATLRARRARVHRGRCPPGPLRVLRRGGRAPERGPDRDRAHAGRPGRDLPPARAARARARRAWRASGRGEDRSSGRSWTSAATSSSAFLASRSQIPHRLDEPRPPHPAKLGPPSPPAAARRAPRRGHHRGPGAGGRRPAGRGGLPRPAWRTRRRPVDTGAPSGGDRASTRGALADAAGRPRPARRPARRSAGSNGAASTVSTTSSRSWPSAARVRRRQGAADLPGVRVERNRRGSCLI